MATPTNYYVDPSIAANSGTGTIGDPFGDLQYALNTVTRNATDGDQFNIKAGTDEVLAAAISLATYGAPNTTNPLIFRGYTSTANDRGIAGISGAGSFAIINSSGSAAVFFIDMHLHNCGSTRVVTLGQRCMLLNCEIDNSTGGGCSLQSQALVLGCNFHNLGGVGCLAVDGRVGLSYFKNGTNDFTYAIQISGDTAGADGNIISIDGTSSGIDMGDRCTVAGNSILCAGGTGTGILSDGHHAAIYNNLIEGFSGTGGKGLDGSSVRDVRFYASNAFYNNATHASLSGDVWANFGDNETLSATPFAKSGSDTFANRFIYFAPVDTGNVHGGAYVGGT